MILVDTGPLVGLFDPRDPHHARCRRALENESGPLYTTVPVLTEAFHLLTPGSRGCSALGEFVASRGLIVWYLDDEAMDRCLELMEHYADRPMDLADASLVAAAEGLRTRRVLTVDRRDIGAYRVRRGHRHLSLEIESC